MTGQSEKSYNLPWHQHDNYWISVYAKGGGFSPTAFAILKKIGLEKMPDGCMAIKAPRKWKATWDQVYEALESVEALDYVEAAVTPGAEWQPGRFMPGHKAILTPQVIASSLWVGDALLENRLMCYLQPVVSAKDKVFGYESFARVKSLEGDIIGGEQIVTASKVLGIEFTIDRHLHVQAIKTFASSNFNGFLFVNFFPGFIHRPAVYLEGLTETAKTFGVVAKHIVLDFTKSETPHDIAHIKSVTEYCRSKGYSIALDDVTSIESARKLIPELRPDFVKIDMHLVRQVKDIGKRETIRTIVEMVHAAAGTVIAEGVESDEIFHALKELGVDLFQGYLFSPPVPVEAALKKAAN